MSTASRGAIDRRLLSYTRATRQFLAASVLLGALTALLVIAQAWLLAEIIAGAFAGAKGSAALAVPLEALLLVVVARATIAWLRELLAQRSSARAKSELRAALLQHAGALGPRNLGERRTGGLAVLATKGIDR